MFATSKLGVYSTCMSLCVVVLWQSSFFSSIFDIAFRMVSLRSVETSDTADFIDLVYGNAVLPDSLCDNNPALQPSVIVHSSDEEVIWDAEDECTTFPRRQLWKAKVLRRHNALEPTMQERLVTEFVGNATSVTQCNAGHALSMFSTDVHGYTCDLCDDTFDEEAAMWGCRVCDFDMCGDCRRAVRPVTSFEKVKGFQMQSQVAEEDEQAK